MSDKSRTNSTPAADDQGEAKASPRKEVTAPYVLTEDVDGIGPKGRIVKRTPSAAKALPCRKAKPRDLAIAQG